MHTVSRDGCGWRSFHRSIVLLAALTSLVAGENARSATLFGPLGTGELYRSVDGGANWSIHATLPARDAVGLSASNTASSLTIFTRSGSVYQSNDSGVSWSALGALPATDVAAFTVLPDSKILVLTGSGSLYQSADGGDRGPEVLGSLRRRGTEDRRGDLGGSAVGHSAGEGGAP